MVARAALAAALLFAASIAVLVTFVAADGARWLAVASVVLAALALGTVSLALLRLSGAARRVSDAARSLAAGDFQARAGDTGEGAPSLGTTFDAMAASVERVVASAREERRRLTAALDSSVDAVVALDATGSVAYANRAAGELLGRPADSLPGERFAYLMANDEVVEALRSSREQGEPRTRMVQRDRGQWLQVSVTPIAEGGEWPLLVVMQDVSDVKRVEQVRKEFIANVSHELRTPLAGVKSVLETLEGGAVSDEKTAREFIARADAEVDRLVRMVEELLELSRIESGEVLLTKEPVALRQVAGEAVARMKHRSDRAGVSVTLEDGPDEALVLGDPDLLERAVINLISNAIKFTPDGGSVSVSVEQAAGAAKVRVSDTGVGIDPGDLPRVFERFYKVDRARRMGGTGLGLAVVRHTVEAHGGEVGVESEPGKGSAFWFRLPLAADQRTGG